jgi:hypothetical protein
VDELKYDDDELQHVDESSGFQAHDPSSCPGWQLEPVRLL